MRSDIVPGRVFPDFELPDHTNEMRKLSELQGDDPLILTLARGHYCPKEHQQHLELAAFYPKIAVAYTQVVTIATDDHHTLQEFRGSVGAEWTFLSDPDRIVQKDLDIQEYTDPEHDPMIPHTLVLKPGLVIYSIYNGYWFWGLPSVVDLWHDLRAVTSEIRPDWDLSSPGSARHGMQGTFRLSTGGISRPVCRKMDNRGLHQDRRWSYKRYLAEMGRLLSVNVGLPRDVTWNGKTVRTAVWKFPVAGRRMVRTLNIDGDGQGDLAGHGGEHRAVFVYQMGSYHYWERFLGRNDFTFGQFGENFTVEGLPCL